MKLLVVMKRFGANKDMVMENFGRQIRLFEPLAKRHKIDFFCPDYTKKESKIVNKNGIRYFISPFSSFNFLSFFSNLNKVIKEEKYDTLAATTDPLIGILSYYYSKKYNIPLVYDLQDNFESYETYKIPFAGYFDKKALKNADAVLTVSESLKNYISKIRKKPIYVINNGIDLRLFKHIGKIKARKILNLPLKSKIVVFIGHLEKLKGGLILIDAFEKIKKKYPDTYLLLSGRIDRSINIKRENIIFREFRKREDVVLGINSADVAVLPNPVNSFTKYCFPYKLIEYMACNVPIVATDVGDVSFLLKKYNGSLCKPNDADDLAEKLIIKLKENKKVDYKKDLKNLEWKVLSKKLDKILWSLK